MKDPQKTVMVFIEKDGAVLMQRRLNTWFGNNQFAVPGGNVDEGETPEAAAIREVKEETGLDIQEADLVLLSETKTKEHDRHFHNFYFHTTNFTGEPENLEPERHADLGWYDRNNLPQDTMDLVRTIITTLV